MIYISICERWLPIDTVSVEKLDWQAIIDRVVKYYADQRQQEIKAHQILVWRRTSGYQRLGDIVASVDVQPLEFNQWNEIS